MSGRFRGDSQSRRRLIQEILESRHLLAGVQESTEGALDSDGQEEASDAPVTEGAVEFTQEQDDQALASADGAPTAAAPAAVGEVVNHLGPEMGDPTFVPTPCTTGPGEFCLSDNVYSWDSFIWIEDELVPAPSSSDDAADVDPWFWYVDFVLISSDTPAA